MVVVGGYLFEDLDGRGQRGDGGGSGETEGIDCGGWTGVEVGVDANGVGEGKRRNWVELWNDDVGEVWEVDGVLLKDLVY